MIISDVAKDCIDSLKRNEDSSDRLSAERVRLSMQSHPPSGPELFPPIFRYGSTGSGVHRCLYCDRQTRVTADSIAVLATYPANFIAVCADCTEQMQ